MKPNTVVLDQTTVALRDPSLSKSQSSQDYIRVKSDKGLAGLALFGTNKLDVISAVPAQTVPVE